jgi:hypothetical protein
MPDSRTLLHRHSLLLAVIEQTKKLAIEYKTDVQHRIGCWAALSRASLSDWNTWKEAFEQALTANNLADLKPLFRTSPCEWPLFRDRNDVIIPLAFCELVQSFIAGNSELDHFQEVLNWPNHTDYEADQNCIRQRILTFAQLNSFPLAKSYADRLISKLSSLDYSESEALAEFQRELRSFKLESLDEWWLALEDWKRGVVITDVTSAVVYEIPNTFWPDWHEWQSDPSQTADVSNVSQENSNASEQDHVAVEGSLPTNPMTPVDCLLNHILELIDPPRCNQYATLEEYESAGPPYYALINQVLDWASSLNREELAKLNDMLFELGKKALKLRYSGSVLPSPFDQKLTRQEVYSLIARVKGFMHGLSIQPPQTSSHGVAPGVGTELTDSTNNKNKKASVAPGDAKANFVLKPVEDEKNPLGLVLSVYANGVCDDRIRQVQDTLASEKTANEKLEAIDKLMPIPPTASARTLGAMLGVSSTAVKKERWWLTNRKGKKLQARAERLERLRERSQRADTGR